MRIKAILQNKVVKNASWLIGGKIAQMIISFLVNIFTARYLGPSNYGVLNYGASIMAFFTPVCTLGIDSIIVNELIVHKNDEEKLIGSGIALRTLTSLVSIGLIQLLVMFLEPTDTLIWWVTFLQSGMLLFKAFDLIEYYYQSKLESKKTSIITMIAYFITSAYKVFLLVTGKSVEWFAFSSTLDILLVAILYVFLYYGLEKKKVRISVRAMKQLLGKSYHFILSSVMVALYAQMDRVMLGYMLDTAAVGLYTVGTTISNLWVFILTAIINSIRPSIIEAKKAGNQELYEARVAQLYAIVFWCGMCASAGLCILARPIVGILYGSAYMGSIGAFRIVTWYTAFSYLGVARSTWMVCENTAKYEKVIAAIGAGSNAVLNWILISLYGICGAAAATLLTQIITNFLVPFFIKDIRRNSELIWISMIHPVKSLKGKVQ